MTQLVEVVGAWDIYDYHADQNNPGPVARFAANQPDGKLSHSFEEVKDPKKLELAMDYGWGWGDTTQGADGDCIMLLDAKANGYDFEVHRFKGAWVIQWAPVTGGVRPKDRAYGTREIDATRAAVKINFGGAATTSLSQLVLLGTQNFDEEVFNKITLDITK